MSGMGISTAALCAGGLAASTYSGVTETWDASSWTEQGDLNTGRNAGAGAGTTALAVVAAGQGPASGNVANATEEWTEAATAGSFTSS